jgi:tetratricopeptide (TPR) repeat protein
MDTAIEALQVVVKDDPTYKDSMTLLGRAYYRKGHYDISRQVLERALLLNKDDEVAWLNLGLAQLKLGDDDAGMETLGGAITLVSKVSRSGYRNFPRWDSKGVVRTAISRAVVAYKKGLEEKDGIVRAVELILVRMDDEENFQKIDTSREWRRNQP